MVVVLCSLFCVLCCLLCSGVTPVWTETTPAQGAAALVDVAGLGRPHGFTEWFPVRDQSVSSCCNCAPYSVPCGSRVGLQLADSTHAPLRAISILLFFSLSLSLPSFALSFLISPSGLSRRHAHSVVSTEACPHGVMYVSIRVNVSCLLSLLYVLGLTQHMKQMMFPIRKQTMYRCRTERPVGRVVMARRDPAFVKGMSDFNFRSRLGGFG